MTRRSEGWGRDDGGEPRQRLTVEAVNEDRLDGVIPVFADGVGARAGGVDTLGAVVFKLLLNGTRVEVASGSNEGTSTSVLSGDPDRAAPASALMEMDAATGMRR